MHTTRRTVSAIATAVLMVTVTACDRDADPAAEVEGTDDEEMMDDEETADDEEMMDDEETG